jgi:hypothetical protein
MPTGASSLSMCMACVAGKYSEAMGVSTCTACVSGKYSTATGASFKHVRRLQCWAIFQHWGYSLLKVCSGDIFLRTGRGHMR